MKFKENKKHIYKECSVNITPYNESNLKRINSEEEYYYKRINSLVESEIDILKMIDNKNIIQYFSSSIDDNIYCIKMEYCNNGDLYTILKESTLIDRNIYNGFKIDFIEQFVEDISNGLMYIHDLNIIHRDVKLHNILLSSSSSSSNKNKYIFKLSDFGFSCLDANVKDILSDLIIDSDKKSLKKKYYKICGTPYYMAPEIILNIHKFENLFEDNKKEKILNYTSKIDMWSFGICLYEVIFNELPFNNIIIEDIHDLVKYFSNIKNQNKIYNCTNKKLNNNKEENYKDKDKEKEIRFLLKMLLTINDKVRYSSFDLINFKTKNNIELIDNFNRELSEQDNNNDSDNNDSNSDNNDSDNNESWFIQNMYEKDDGKHIEAWDTINKASSLIMKLSVDTNFMKWLLKKK